MSSPIQAAPISGQCKDIGLLKGPNLLGLASRAPYFHNGSAATLMDVVNFYDRRFNIGFTGQEKEDWSISSMRSETALAATSWRGAQLRRSYVTSVGSGIPNFACQQLAASRLGQKNQSRPI
jgi:hypothetical protein